MLNIMPELSTKFIMLINVKMPTFVGILTFISMSSTAIESLNAMSKYFSIVKFLIAIKILCSAELSMKSFQPWGLVGGGVEMGM